MIAHKGREGKRGKLKMTKNLERLFKEVKCRDCSVVVTRMDFAKILGKFTKVKIQYESSTSPKSQKPTDAYTHNVNARLKNNENGMVLIRRNVYNQHPAKEPFTKKKHKNNEVLSNIASPPKKVSNILKENNGLKKTLPTVDKNSNYNKKQIESSTLKQYAIIFNDPISNNNIDVKVNLSLLELLPNVNKSILPSEEWCIDYLPKTEEPKDDKVYDRIAAELEDLMYNEPVVKAEAPENKVDEFPSIMDILNDNSSETTPEPKESTNIEFKDNLQSSDVEAMLLGKVNENKIIENPPIEVDNTDINKIIEDVAFVTNESDKREEVENVNEIDNPHSPSILDEALQKGIEEHLPNNHTHKDPSPLEINNVENENVSPENKSEMDTISNNETETINNEQSAESISNPLTPVENGLNISPIPKFEDVTHVVFKKIVDGICQKSVTCPKNLKYIIEFEEKSIEFLGAPKYISSLEDLQVLLQIVNETSLQSLYVLY